MANENLTFSFKPRLMGPSYEYQLSKDALDWAIGPRTGRVSYPMIRHIRLGYKPTNTGAGRFIAEIWTLNTPKLVLNSVSAKSIIDNEDRGTGYTLFLRELHRRIVEANGECRYEAGMPAWRWWPAIGVALAALAGVVYVLLHGLIAGQFGLAAIVGLTGAWFMWQIWNIIKRNRPRTYSPDNIPEDVLPTAVDRINN